MGEWGGGLPRLSHPSFPSSQRTLLTSSHNKHTSCPTNHTTLLTVHTSLRARSGTMITCRVQIDRWGKSRRQAMIIQLVLSLKAAEEHLRQTIKSPFFCLMHSYTISVNAKAAALAGATVDAKGTGAALAGVDERFMGHMHQRLGALLGSRYRVTLREGGNIVVEWTQHALTLASAFDIGDVLVRCLSSNYPSIEYTLTPSYLSPHSTQA